MTGVRLRLLSGLCWVHARHRAAGGKAELSADAQHPHDLVGMGAAATHWVVHAASLALVGSIAANSAMASLLRASKASGVSSTGAAGPGRRCRGGCRSRAGRTALAGLAGVGLAGRSHVNYRLCQIAMSSIIVLEWDVFPGTAVDHRSGASSLVNRSGEAGGQCSLSEERGSLRPLSLRVGHRPTAADPP